MNEHKEDQLYRIKELEEQVVRLNRERQVLLSAMETAGNLSNFQMSTNKMQDAAAILRTTASRAHLFIGFKAVSFYLVDESDSSFNQAYCDSEEFIAYFEREVDAVIEDSTFSWALRRRKPVIIAATTDTDQLLLHSLQTSSRTRGMFVGLLEQDKRDITDIAFFLFTTAMSAASDALESFELYRQIKNVNSVLAANVKKLEESERELIQHRSHLERLVAKRTEALRTSEEKYRSIFENSVEGIFQALPDGRFISVNPAFARMHGYGSPRELIDDAGRLHRAPGAFLERQKEYARLMKEDGCVVNFETRLFRKDDGLSWVSVNARVVRDEAGEIGRFEGAVMDISDKKMLEAQLLQAQKMEAIGTLAGGVAHDFNNILMALMGYTNLLQMKMDPRDPLRDYVNQILISTEKAARLTQSLLTFGRKQMMELKPQRVSDLLKDAERLLGPLLPEDIYFRVASDIEDSIMADSGQIEQVLMNLATNARDAMPKGGELKIEASRVEMDGEFVRSHGYGKLGSYVLISVRDTGTGMDEKTRERIFEPFFTTKEVGKGTGLGLSIVYGIVHQHGGFVIVESEADSGTSFLVYIPLIETEKSTKQRTATDVRGGNETILFAEDNPDIRSIAREILGMYGYTVLEAEDGEDAIRKFKEYQHLVDLLVLDVVMPAKNGNEAYEEIRSMRPDIPAIFVSGYTGDIILNKGIPGRATDFVPKPISPNALLTKVREVLDRQVN
jgi:PAS domain S-box-containing protein